MQSFENLIKITERKQGIFVTKTRTLKDKRNEDKVYLENPGLADVLYRGDTILSDRQGKTIAVLKGIRKFDGTNNAIDEDDFEGEAKSLIDKKLLKKWEDDGELSVSYMEKANGKFFVVMFLRYEGKLYIFGGSKNVHLIQDVSEEIKGNDLVHDILRTVMKAIPDSSLFEGKTLIGEYVDGMHLVWTENPYVVFFNDDTGTLPSAPFLFPSTNHLPSEELLAKIRRLKNTEGVVILYKNTRTGEVHRQKHKTIWYVLLRTMREGLCRYVKKDHDSLLPGRIVARIEDRSEKFLYLTEEELQEWREIAISFTTWMYTQEKYQFSDLGPFSSVGFARVWKDFLGRNVQPVEKPVHGLLYPSLFDAVIQALKMGLSVDVIMSGLPGSGKSTIAKRLLEIVGEDAEIFSTDNHFIMNGVYKFDPSKLKLHHDLNFQRFSLSGKRLRIVDNTNLSKWEYDRYLSHPSSIARVRVILQTKLLPLEILAKSGHHLKDLGHLRKMSEKYTEHYPMYVGVFLSEEEKVRKMYSADQRTPLHLTLSYFGGKSIEKKLVEKYGTMSSLEVLGLSKSKEGSCLTLGNNDHITLRTNKGFKPVDVGKAVTVENTSPEKLSLEGIVLPMF